MDPRYNGRDDGGRVGRIPIPIPIPTPIPMVSGALVLWEDYGKVYDKG